MDRPMINETLLNTERYDELRDMMITELVADEMDQPANVLRALLEDYVWHMFKDMEDDVLQVHYDQLKQDEVDPDGITDMFEPTVVEAKNE